MKKVLLFALLSFLFVVLGVSCDSNSVETLFDKQEAKPIDTKIEVISVSLDKDSVTLDVGQSETLVATIIPSNATNQKVTWSSSDPDVVTVDENGTLTAKKAGRATITVTTEDGAKTCTVVVNSECLAEGTMITMANGSKKAVENLTRGEKVLTFDHETGLLSSSEIVDYYMYTENSSGVMTLHFSDGIDVTVVVGHSFYDKDEKKYVQITIANAQNYINHEFFCAQDMSWKTLEGYTLETEKKDAYVVVTKNHLNCIANGMLSVEDDIYWTLANVFEFDDNMKINQSKKAADILKYGLWTYEDINYLTEEAFEGLNLKYFGILVGKGILTREGIDYVCANVSAFDPEIVRPEMR